MFLIIENDSQICPIQHLKQLGNIKDKYILGWYGVPIYNPHI